MMERVKKHLRELGETLKPMPWKKRIDHLWTYYKSVLVVAAIIICIIAIVITGVTNANRVVMVSGALVNADVGLDGRAYLTDGFQEAMGEDAAGDTDITNVYFENPETTQEIEQTYNAMMRVVAMTAAQELDYYICDKVGMETYLGHDMFLDLTQVLTAQELEQFADDLIYMTYEETGETIPVAINLRNTAFGKRFSPAEKNHYLSFAGNTPRMEACRNIWQHIKNEAVLSTAS